MHRFFRFAQPHAPRATRSALAALLPPLGLSLSLIVSLFVVGCGAPVDDDADAQDSGLEETVEDDVAEDSVDTKKTYTGKCASGPTMCDDGNLCTADDCDPFTGCQNIVKTCANDDACTIDYCDIATGDCRHDAESCEDNNICTINVCKEGEGCVVESTLNCEDDDKCTADGCSPAKGCVSSPQNCDDSQKCTTDSCDPKVGCVNKGPTDGSKCCDKATDCADNSVCTQHTCNAGLCKGDPIFGCCKIDSDCDDDNGCTTDKCSVATGQCSNAYAPGSGCCALDVDCHDGDDCTSDACVGGKCGHDVICCAAAADCGKAGPIGSCAEVTCTTAGCGSKPTGKAGCCTPNVAKTDFEDAKHWPVKLVPATNGKWRIDTSAKLMKTGTSALVYEGAANQIPGGDSLARAAFDEIELPAATQVSLRFWLLSKPGPQSPKEVLRLRIRTSAGEWHVWQKNGTSSAYQFVSIDLSSFAARASTRKVRLLFEVQPSSKLQPTAEFRIDGLVVTSTCSAKSCTTASQCNDQLAASKETCVNGTCVYSADEEYCEYADHKSCNDDDFCTSDYCSINTCKHFPIGKCCHNDGECLDKDACTLDACVNKKCVNKKAPTDGKGGCCSTVSECDDANPCTLDACPAVGLPCQHTKTDQSCCIADDECDDNQSCTIDTCNALKCGHQNECCKSDADCDDGNDKCTTDKCSPAGKCSWTPTGAKGCCEKEQFSAGFEGKKLSGFTLQSSLKTSMWQPVVGAKAFKGKGALYYGNLAKGNYDDQISTGTVTSGEITIAAKEKTQLTFALYMDTETSATYDKLEVTVFVGAKQYMVWNKKAVGFAVKKWVEYTVDLSAFAGKAVKVQFLFGTNDPVANTGEGVYLDEVRIDRSCADRVCNTPADCNDGHAFSVDGCTGGVCSFGI